MIEFESYRELKKHPEARDYRDAMAKALNIARSYDGSEQSYLNLLESLETVEEGITTSPSLQETTSTERDMEAALTFAPKRPREINDVLALAVESLHHTIHNAVEHPETSDKIVMNRIEGVLLPSGTGAIIPGGVSPFKEARFEPRIEEVIAILKKLELYSDDIIVTIGDTPEGTMRETSYVAIDIPRIDRMILVCNQVGEATFVITGRVSVKTLLTTAKENLSDAIPGHVTKIIRNAQWEGRLTHTLTHEMGGEVNRRKEKINVREVDQDELRAALFEKYPTFSDWYAAFRSSDQGIECGTEIEVTGRKLVALATRFGFSERPYAPSSFLRLSRIIYGDDPVLLAEAEKYETKDPEVWRAAILKKYPTAKVMFDTFHSGKRDGWNIEVEGKKLNYLCTQFGISRKQSRKKIIVLLAEAMYGVQDDTVQVERNKVAERSLDEWRVLIIEKFPTSEAWMMAYRGENGSQQGAGIEVAGRRIKLLAHHFGVVINTNRQVLLPEFIQLGLQIYGERDELLLREMLIAAGSVEEWRNEILKQYPTSADWILGFRGDDGNRAPGSGITVLGRRINAIAARFGFETPTSSKNFLRIGMRIYGENDPALRHELARLEGLGSAFWTQRILEKYPTSAEWMKEFRDTRQGEGLNVDGKALTFLAKQFGIGKDARRVVGAIALGFKIYGENDALLLKELANLKRE